MCLCLCVGVDGDFTLHFDHTLQLQGLQKATLSNIREEEDGGFTTNELTGVQTNNNL